MTNRAFATVVMAVLFVGCGSPSAFGQAFSVYRSSAGNQSTSQTNGITTNTFTGLTVGAYGTSTSPLAAGSPGVTTGTYTGQTNGNGFGIFNDSFGISGNNYFSTGARASQVPQGSSGSSVTLDKSATLQLSTTNLTHYFGLFWLAVDAGNQLDFYNGSNLVGTVTANQLLADTGTFLNPGINRSNSTTYNGTGGNGSGNNTGEKSVYINVYTDATHGFDRVVLKQRDLVAGLKVIIIVSAQQSFQPD